MNENTNPETAELLFDGKKYSLPVRKDNQGQKGIDIRNLRRDAGLITYDPGFANTASCQSSVSHVDGEGGRLLYRGYAIEDLTDSCTFVEVGYLLIHGRLPTRIGTGKVFRLAESTLDDS